MGVTEQDAKIALLPRYQAQWREPFERSVRSRLRNSLTALDVGSGRRPALPPERRPAGLTYVGMDLSQNELQSAEPGSHDEMVVADVSTRVPELVGKVDLAVSWQMFEHVSPLRAAFDNLHAYRTRRHPSEPFVWPLVGIRSGELYGA